MEGSQSAATLILSIVGGGGGDVPPSGGVSAWRGFETDGVTGGFRGGAGLQLMHVVIIDVEEKKEGRGSAAFYSAFS